MEASEKPCQLCGRPVEWGKLCRVCKGFEQPKEEPVAVKFECKICGDKKISNFYSSVRNLCKKHHNERCKERQRSHPPAEPQHEQDLQQAFKEMDAMPEVPDRVQEKVMDAISQPPKSHICKVCGHEFEAYQHGVVKMTRMCRDCITKKVSSATRNRPVKIPSHVPNIVIYFEDGDEAILSRISEEAKRNRRTLSNQVLFMIEEALNA